MPEILSGVLETDMEGGEERENINEEEGNTEDGFDTENKEGDSFILIVSKTVKQLEQ